MKRVSWHDERECKEGQAHCFQRASLCGTVIGLCADKKMMISSQLCLSIAYAVNLMKCKSLRVESLIGLNAFEFSEVLSMSGCLKANVERQGWLDLVAHKG